MVPETQPEKLGRPLRVAVIGAGRWGTNYVHTLAGLPDCRVVAVVDPDPEVRARAVPIAALSSLDKLLANGKPDAVVISTPDHTHQALAVQCLETDIDVLVEKPMVSDPAGADRLVALADSRGLILGVGHNTIYNPRFDRLAARVAGGELGRPLQIHSHRTSRGREGSDPLRDLAPHDIAMAIHLFGAPARVRARRSDTGAGFELQYENGLHMSGSVEWSPTRRVRRFTVTGTDRTATLDETVAAPRQEDLPLTRLCRDFIRCSLERTAPKSDGRLGRKVVSCLSAIAESLRREEEWLPLRAAACCS